VAVRAGAASQTQSLPSHSARAEIDQKLEQARQAGLGNDLRHAEELFSQAESQSLDARYEYGRATAVVGLGNCELAKFAFRSALARYLEARELAKPLNDALLSGKIAASISAIYAALNSASEASAELSKSILLLSQARDLQAKQVLLRALLLQARLRFDQPDHKGWREAIEDAISKAREWKDPQSAQAAIRSARPEISSIDLAAASESVVREFNNNEALAWYYRGYYCLELGLYEEAGQSLETALRLEPAAGQPAMQVARAAVKLQLNHPQEALEILDAALATHSPSMSSLVWHEVLDWRGRMLLASGHDDEALATFEQATRYADQWRASALPGDVSSTGTLSYFILQRVYTDHYQLAAKLALKRNNPALAREALEVVVRQRAANLREEAALSLNRLKRLPQEYYQLLGRLKVAQAQALAQPGATAESSAAQIREQLAEIEDKAGLPAPEFSRDGERNLRQKSLSDIQQCLGTEDVLLSFALGEEGSAVTFLWTTTKDSVKLYALANRRRIERAGNDFREAVQAKTRVAETGRALSLELFGALPELVMAKSHWLVAPDGDLLNSIPWTALPESASNPDPIILKRDIRLVPSELLLAGRSPQPRGDGFVGVGDPIYNRADRRLKANVSAAKSGEPKPPDMKTLPVAIPLARLAGSGNEVRVSSSVWNSKSTKVLTGAQATSEAIQKAIESEQPALIHFAVHVLNREDHPEQAALALSLDSSGRPELLTQEAVSSLRVPGSIVVLSGCASEKGRVVPGAGLMGLSRAWLLAGASAVIVSAWPTPDDSGLFFEVFYQQLAQQKAKSTPLVERAATALEEAQQQMRRDGGFRGSPSYWAAYALISKE
jgi:CHAT domain-containing protein